MGLHYGFPKRQAAERGVRKQRREQFQAFKKMYEDIFPKNKLEKWENKVKSKVNKVKKMSPQQIAKLIRAEAGGMLDLSRGLNFNEYRDIVKDYLLKEAKESFTSIFKMPFDQVQSMLQEQADASSELFADRQYAAKMAEMMNRLNYKGDPEKLIESYRRSGDDGMYDFTKEKINKINKIITSDPETYGGQDTVKDTRGFIKTRLINQGYSPEVAEQMAEEQAGAAGAPGAIDKLDKRYPNPFTDFNPRNDRELLYKTTEPGSPLDPMPTRPTNEYYDSPTTNTRGPAEEGGFGGQQTPSHSQNQSGLGDDVMRPDGQRPMNRRPGRGNIKGSLQNPFVRD